MLTRLLARPVMAEEEPPAPRRARHVGVVPVTHGTVSGWLVDFNLERNYVVNNHVSHIERLDAQP